MQVVDYNGLASGVLPGINQMTYLVIGEMMKKKVTDNNGACIRSRQRIQDILLFKPKVFRAGRSGSSCLNMRLIEVPAG